MNRLIFTEIELERNQEQKPFCLWAFMQEDTLMDLRLFHKDNISLVGNIYIGKVLRVDWNLNAAYITYAKGCECFTSLKYLSQAIFTKKVSHKSIGAGDEVLVQIDKDALKTKIPGASFDLNFHLPHAIMTTGNLAKGISAKIKGEERKSLQDFLQKDCDHLDQYGILLRTNARDVSIDDLAEELTEGALQISKWLKQVTCKSLYSLAYKAQPRYLTYAKSFAANQVQDIVTDIPDIHHELATQYEQARLYEDDYSLVNLYGLKTKIERATSKVVHLKSGASLVIEPTEAMTVIDVNSGKISKKKINKDYYLQINLEAAKEIARQIRIRNISGIVIVDFISMKTEQETILLDSLKAYLSQDRVPAKVVDMTKLGLVEITRKKVSRTLKEEIDLGFKK